MTKFLIHAVIIICPIIVNTAQRRICIILHRVVDSAWKHAISCKILTVSATLKDMPPHGAPHWYMNFKSDDRWRWQKQPKHRTKTNYFIMILTVAWHHSWLIQMVGLDLGNDSKIPQNINNNTKMNETKTNVCNLRLRTKTAMVRVQWLVQCVNS